MVFILYWIKDRFSLFSDHRLAVLRIYNMLLFFSLDTQYVLFYGHLKIIVFITGQENSWSLTQEFFIYNRSELTLYEFSFALGHQLYFQ